MGCSSTGNNGCPLLRPSGNTNTCFCHLRNRGYGTAISINCHQHWLSRQIVIPKIMVNSLKMPLLLAGCAVYCNYAVAE